MQIMDDGTHLLIYSNGIKAYEKLPINSNYSVEYEPAPGVGFYLSQKKKFEKPSFKLYGNQLSLVDDILNAFERSDKSIGVILSGAKGTGKTVFSKMLSAKANEKGLPTVLVNNNVSGVSNFLARIDEPSLIMFDEFEKKFQDSLQPQVGSDSQSDMLSLFDGVMGGKNLYVLTVNDIVDLSPYLLNRPGRFMYSIRMNEPSPKNIKDYLHDKLDKDVDNREAQIDDIIRFSFKFPLSYDILDTLVFQLNAGKQFKEVLPSLNLMNFGDIDYNVDVEFEGGYTYSIRESNIDLFKDTVRLSDEDISFDFRSDDLKVEDLSLSVKGKSINRVKVDGSLKDKVQSGLRPEEIVKIVIKPTRSDDFGFNI